MEGKRMKAAKPDMRGPQLGPRLKKRLQGLTGKEPSYHEGANDERTAILAKIKRMKKTTELGKQVLEDLQAWVYRRNERYRKNPGGL